MSGAQSRKQQIAICVLTMVLAPLMMVPLELQRQITNKAVESRDVTLLIELGIVYFLVICVQGSMKYALNMLKGQSVEVIARDIRQRIVERVSASGRRGGWPARPSMPGPSFRCWRRKRRMSAPSVAMPSACRC